MKSPIGRLTSCGWSLYSSIFEARSNVSTLTNYGPYTAFSRHDAAKGSRGAKLTLKMLEKPEWLLSTTLVGTNIAVVTNTTMATALRSIYLENRAVGWLFY